jgi:hypothetical protein
MGSPSFCTAVPHSVPVKPGRSRCEVSWKQLPETYRGFEQVSDSVVVYNPNELQSVLSRPTLGLHEWHGVKLEDDGGSCVPHVMLLATLRQQPVGDMAVLQQYECRNCSSES